MPDEISHQLHFASVNDKPATLPKIWAVLCALLVTATLLGGFFVLHKRQQQAAAAAAVQQATAKQNAPVAAQIFEDEAQLKGEKALVGGLVRNVSNARMDDLIVEIELLPRTGASVKLVQVKIEPASLNPGGDGRYALFVSSHQWSATHITRLLSVNRNTEIAFKSQPGARRPLEQPAQGTRVIVVPKSKGKGDEFLNTPDNPIPIR